INSIYNLGNQVLQAWEEIQRINIAENFKNIANVVISGMGGSALGGRVVDSLLVDRVRVPIEIISDYKLPAYINNQTLVILSSYSGNTQETLSAYHDALNKDAQIFAITTGGELGSLLTKNNNLAYIFNPKYNPSHQPRMGLGYSISSTLAILSLTKVLYISDDEVANIVQKINQEIESNSLDVTLGRNLAKGIAFKLKDKIVNIISSEHLSGISHAFKNQINENSKTFSNLFEIPELNHHLIEGLQNPRMVLKSLIFLFIESELYSLELRKRYPLTKEVLGKNNLDYVAIKLKLSTKLEQIFELLTIGSFVSFYLAMLYEIDPTPIPWVDYFKARLSK
ncbi:MAG: bifunctional phosphoglucose/phosphomannose isomerase, partial [Patescibacteria group bacterium]